MTRVTRVKRDGVLLKRSMWSQRDEATVKEGVAESLAKFKQPKRVVVVDELPRNTMGKVQKNVMRETYADLLKA